MDIEREIVQWVLNISNFVISCFSFTSLSNFWYQSLKPTYIVRAALRLMVPNLCQSILIHIQVWLEPMTIDIEHSLYCSSQSWVLAWFLWHFSKWFRTNTRSRSYQTLFCLFLQLSFLTLLHKKIKQLL